MTDQTVAPQEPAGGAAAPESADIEQQTDDFEAAFDAATAGDPEPEDKADDAALEHLAGRDDGSEDEAPAEKPEAKPAGKPAEKPEAKPVDRTAVLEEKLKRATGQVSALSRLLDKERKAGKSAAAPQLSAEEQAEFDRLKADYPDIVKLFELQARNMGRAPSDNEMLETVQTLAEQVRERAQVEQNNAVAEAIQYVESQRPGWLKAVQTEDFKRFAASTPGRQALFQSSSVEDTIDLYDAFINNNPRARAAASAAAAADPHRGATAKTVAQARQQRVAQSEGIAGRDHAIALGDTDPGDFESMFNAAAKELDRRRARSMR